jgi:fatty-acyl-CoA synthase
MHAADLLSRRAELTPDREALLDLTSGRRFTYAALNARANRAANWLRACGVQPGDRVSLLAHNGVIYVELLYGCGKIGAVFTPLNWRLAPAELAYILEDCTPPILIYAPEFAETAQALGAAIGRQELLPQAQYEEAARQQPSGEPPRPPDLDGESAHCILYTSGTTGRPKGAIIPHRQVLWNAINTVISWELTAQDVSPIFTPMFHSGGLFVFLTPLFYAGGRVILSRGFDAQQSLRLLERERCTVVLGVPTLFQEWLKTPGLSKIDFSQMRWFISGGAPCPPSIIDAWREQTGSVFRQGYGLTEVGPNCCSMTDEESVSKAGSVGKAIFHSQMRLVDAAGDDVPTGEAGELLIRGPHVCGGYLHNPQATVESLRDGWFHTGDMARADEDGFLYIVGRFKDMIISGGENIYAAEVESVFLEHPAVAECALIGQPDPQWGEVGLMVTVLTSGASATEQELQDFCRRHLARYKTPKRVIFADSLPYSPYGKVMKAELRKSFLPDSASN